MYLSCPTMTSFPAIFRGKLPNSLHCIPRIKLLLLLYCKKETLDNLYFRKLTADLLKTYKVLDDLIAVTL